MALRMKSSFARNIKIAAGCWIYFNKEGGGTELEDFENRQMLVVLISFLGFCKKRKVKLVRIVPFSLVF